LSKSPGASVAMTLSDPDGELLDDELVPLSDELELLLQA
jgi:hypothetical protein